MQAVRTLKPSQFGSAFAWLLSKDVSSARIASLFQTNSTAVRVAAHRWRSSAIEATPSLLAFDHSPTVSDHLRLGVRSDGDEVVRTPIGTRALESLQDRITAEVALRRSDYEYLKGVGNLRRLAPLVGYPSDVRRLHIAALLHQQIAWLLVHSGFCHTAMIEASTARDLWRVASHEAPERIYTEELIQSVLIASNAALLSRQPEAALSALELVPAAAQHIGAQLGSDYYRQRGVALFQMRQDEQAHASFQQSMRTMEKLGESQSPAMLLMTGARYTSLLAGPDWDRSQEVLDQSLQTFGEQSLEYSMCLHWAAACAFLTDSGAVNTTAQEMLMRHDQLRPDFGHQKTIAALLTKTCDLGLDLRLRKAWVRRALYENTFRSQ